MPRLIWSRPALLDVQRLYRFLAEKNVEAAKRAIYTVRSSIKIIEQQPAIGRPVEDMDLEYREWLIAFGDSGYVALYRFDEREIVILAVRHQREVGY